MKFVLFFIILNWVFINIEGQNSCGVALNSTAKYPKLLTFSGRLSLPELTQNTFQFDLGNYDECIHDNNNFCVMTKSLLGVGVCVPKECDSVHFEDGTIVIAVEQVGPRILETLLQVCPNSQNCLTVIDSLNYAILLNSTITFKNLASGAVTCGDNSVKIGSGEIGMIFVVALLGFFVLVGSSISWIKKNMDEVQAQNHSSVTKPLLADENHLESPLQNSSEKTSSKEQKSLTKEKFTLRFLKSFDIFANLRSLVSPRKSGAFDIFDGIRTISMMWVVFGHVYNYQIVIGYSNIHDVFAPNGLIASFTGQVIIGGEFAVDTFFFLSGFLVTYSLAVRLEKLSFDLVLKVQNWVPMFYVHRIIRITPTYMFALFFYWKIGPLLGSGPFWYLMNDENCNDYWWTNLLNINNLYPFQGGVAKQCFSVSWYLANDFQFYVISPIFIIPFVYKKKIGMLFCTIILLLSIAWTIIIVKEDNLSTFLGDGEPARKFQEMFYVAPHLRIPPYLIGMLSAMIWIYKKAHSPNFKVHKNIALILSGFAFFLLGVTCYGSYQGYQKQFCSGSDTTDCGSYPNVSQSTRIAYTSLSRPAWALGIAIITLLSANSQLFYPVNYFLCHEYWTIGARLSFGAYLVHPTVLCVLILTTVTPFHYSVYEISTDFISCLFLTFVFATILSLLVEKPMMNLEKKFLHSSP